MDNDEFWTNLTSLLPSGIESNFNDDECSITSGDKTVTIIKNENDFTVNGKTLHFKENDFEILNTLLVPFVLQELDGNKRF
jgi:hypothetical protein